MLARNACGPTQAFPLSSTATSSLPSQGRPPYRRLASSDPDAKSSTGTRQGCVRSQSRALKHNAHRSSYRIVSRVGAGAGPMNVSGAFMTHHFAVFGWCVITACGATGTGNWRCSPRLRMCQNTITLTKWISASVTSKIARRFTKYCTALKASSPPPAGSGAGSPAPGARSRSAASPRTGTAPGSRRRTPAPG